MAGDWIPIRVGLARDPKVLWMADILAGDRVFIDWLTNPVRRHCNESAYEHVTRDVVASLCITALLQVWGMAREQGTRYRDDLIVTFCNADSISAVAGLPGFGHALVEIGWLVERDDQSAVFPNFFKQKESPSSRFAKTPATRQRDYRERKKKGVKNPPKSVTGKSDGARNEKHNEKHNESDAIEEKRIEEKRRGKKKNKNLNGNDHGPLLLEINPEEKKISPTSSSSALRPGRKPDPLVERFEQAYFDHYELPHPRPKAGFIQFAELKKRLGDRLTIDKWEKAVVNYFLTPLSKHTLAHLSADFDDFHRSAKDRFNKPLEATLLSDAGTRNELSAQEFIHRTKGTR